MVHMGIFYRLNTSLHRIYYKKFSRTKWKIVRFIGAEFTMQPSNYIDRRMWAEGAYEKEQLAYMLEQTKKQRFDAFIDVGTNFGLYSCIFGANKAVPTIHSFECDPRNIFHLHGHLRMNDLMNTVTVHPYAVGDEESTITFQMASKKSTGHSYVGASTEGFEAITVEQKPLDTVLKHYTGKHLIFKIDVEGYEEAVLEGMRAILENNACFLQIEIVDNMDKQIEMLASIGYKNIHKLGNDWYFTNIPACEET